MKEKLEKRLSNSQKTLASLHAQLEKKEVEVEKLMLAVKEQDFTHRMECAAQEKLTQTAAFFQEVLLAHRHEAALEVFLCIPIIPDDSMELATPVSASPNGKTTRRATKSAEPTSPMPVQLKGYCTIFDLPFPNSGQVKGIPSEISLSVLTHISFLCNALAAVYNIKCPHPLHVHAHSECAIIEDGAVGNQQLGDVELRAGKREDGDGGYVSVECESEEDVDSRFSSRAGVLPRSARYYYLSPGIKFPAGASVDGVLIGRSINEHVQQPVVAGEIPSLFTASTKLTVNDRRSSSNSSGRTERVRSRAPWELPSTLRNPEVEFIEDGWTRAGGGAGGGKVAPVLMVESVSSHSSHPCLSPISTDFPAAVALLQADVLFVTQHIQSLCGHDGPCFPREAMLLNLQLAQKLCVRQASESATYLCSHNLVEDPVAAAAKNAQIAVNDIFTFAETNRRNFGGPYSSNISQYQQQLQNQQQYIRHCYSR